MTESTQRAVRKHRLFNANAPAGPAAGVLESTKHRPLHRFSIRLRKFRSRACGGSSSFRSSFRRQNAAAVCFSTFCGFPAADPASAY